MEATEGPFEAACEEGDGSVPYSNKHGSLDWLSPRISFSRDFAMAVNESSSCSNGMGRVSPEKRKWEQASEDDLSSEFEFRMSDSRCNASQETGNVMLSADELFVNGKLRPLQLPRDRPPASDDLCLPWRTSEHKHLSSSRHRSLDISHCSSVIPDAGDQPSSLSVEAPRSSSPPRPAIPATSAPTSPRASSKYSAKIKGFFKPKKGPLQAYKDASCAQLSRDNSITSSCRLPISPRSFWPFSRSNSAGESQTTTPAVPDLPRRSNSAGESKSATSTSVTSKSSESNVAAKPCGTSSDSTDQSSSLRGKSNGSSIPVSGSERNKAAQVCGPSAPAPVCQPVSAEQESCASDIRSPSSNFVPVVSLDRDESHSRESAEVLETAGSVGEAGSVKLSPGQCSNQINVPDEGSTSLVEGVNISALKNASRVRGSANHVRLSRRGASSPARNFARGSPGRRGVWNSPGAKGNTGKVMLRNLERCKAGTKVGVGRSQDLRTRSDGRDGFPVTVRVTPVLNVAIYRGKASSTTRLFSFRKLFSSKRKKPLEAPVNNWRNGA